MEARSCAVFCQEKKLCFRLYLDWRENGLNEQSFYDTYYFSLFGLHFTQEKNVMFTIFSQYILSGKLLLTIMDEKVI